MAGWSAVDDGMGGGAGGWPSSSGKHDAASCSEMTRWLSASKDGGTHHCEDATSLLGALAGQWMRMSENTKPVLAWPVPRVARPRPSLVITV